MQKRNNKSNTKGPSMNYLRIMLPDDFMMKIVKALNDEVLKGDVYPLMAAYSENTCDRKYIEGSDYVCVNIKSGNEIFVVDIYPTDPNDTNHRDGVVLSLFRREDPSHKNKWSKSLYKMTPGTKYKDGERDPEIDGVINDRLIGFSPKATWFRRMEKIICPTGTGDIINSVVDELRKIISAIRGKSINKK